MTTIPTATIDLMNVPISGERQMLTRMTERDARLIASAAAKLGYTQSQFMRTAMVNTAKVVLTEEEASA